MGETEGAHGLIEPSTIRPAMAEDMGALMVLLEKVGLFPPHELVELGAMLADYFEGDLGSDHYWITDDDGGPVGVAYYAPERMTDATWNLYLIAVHPERQGEGRGAALLRYVEEMLALRGGRLLLVETSGQASFERTRAFYRRCGYDEEARVRDFYRAGDDKVVFSKALGTLSVEHQGPDEPTSSTS